MVVGGDWADAVKAFPCFSPYFFSARSSLPYEHNPEAKGSRFQKYWIIIQQ